MSEATYNVGGMKILHTSDWHIGRTFHGYATLHDLGVALDALVAVVREREVDVVVVSGDIFDSGMPAADSLKMLTSVLGRMREAGATVVMTSGNHDSATRLGFLSEFAGLAGIHIVTRQEQHDQPVTIRDEYGPVHFYGIPYLEPALIRHHYPDVVLRNHEQVLTFVMRRIRADLARRGGRSVVLAHCFAIGVAASDVERDITAGGIEYVPLEAFDGPDYVALGHIHGRAELSRRVRYSGAPLHYSFAEADKPRGVWLVELGAEAHSADDAATASGHLAAADAQEMASIHVEWVDLPVPRRLTVLTGEIDDLLSDAANSGYENDWVSAILTDQVRPMDGMRRLQQRFSGCVTLEHRPGVMAETTTETYAERVNQKTDQEVIAGFLDHVRNGVGPTQYERELISDVISAVTAGIDTDAPAEHGAQRPSAGEAA